MPVQTIGCFAIYADDGKEVTPKGRKARGVIAYLIGQGAKKVSKERLQAIFWPYNEERQARSSLRQVIHELRCTLAGLGECVFTDREHVWLSPSLLKSLRESDDDSRELYEDLDHITPEFDDWLQAQRTQEVRERILALKREAEQLLDQHEPAKCLWVLEKVQRLDPFDEEAVRIGMRAEYESGHAAGIIERYDCLAASLRGELGIQPCSATKLLRARLVELTSTASSEETAETERQYFERRSYEELEAAARSKSIRARDAHEQLSSKYKELASSIE